MIQNKIIQLFLYRKKYFYIQYHPLYDPKQLYVALTRLLPWIIKLDKLLAVYKYLTFWIHKQNYSNVVP